MEAITVLRVSPLWLYTSIVPFIGPTIGASRSSAGEEQLHEATTLPFGSLIVGFVIY